VTPVEPQPAASVVLVRAGAREPIEVYLIRRSPGMRFLGGFYAFPGGKVETADATAESLARCHGLGPAAADAVIRAGDGMPALTYWVTAARELLEETAICLACDEAGRPVDATRPGVADAIERCRQRLMAQGATLASVLAGEGWLAHVAPLRYLSHFITPTASPIRFSARFFLCPLPAGQTPRPVSTETSEGFWVGAAAGYAGFLAGDLPMAEPAEYALAYLAQFDSIDDCWAAHADRRHKFHGIVDRTDLFYATGFDPAGRPVRRAGPD
jgi:8-oxo-dGTP pyrophosphatase MutT (NUDIX family)